MSNSLAIAAVTATLRNFLDAVQSDFPGTLVTAQPPNTARTSNGINQLNLFLYFLMPNPALRNQDMPGVGAGETGQPPLALDLNYLVTAFGANDDDSTAHQVLGRAMSILHDHSVLNRSAIRNALAGNDLHEQVEAIRITPEPISMDDLFKMWSTYQTEYRISVAYKVSVVLIESQRPIRAPLPVLSTGRTVQSSLIPPFPTITNIQLPNDAPSIRLGERLSILGHHFNGDTINVLFETDRRDNALPLTPNAGATETELMVEIPNNTDAQTEWVAGVYRVTIEITTGGNTRRTNSYPVLLAPRVTSITPNPLSLGGSITLTVATQPQILNDQQTQLLLGSQPLTPENISAIGLTFDLEGIEEGQYSSRLRVDGVDSHVIDYSADPLVYISATNLVVTA